MSSTRIWNEGEELSRSNNQAQNAEEERYQAMEGKEYIREGYADGFVLVSKKCKNSIRCANTS